MYRLTSVRPSRWIGGDSCKRKIRIPGHGKIFNGEASKSAASAVFVKVGDLLQALRDVEREIDNHAIGGSLNFVVAEQNISSVKIQCFVNDIWLGLILLNGCWPTKLGFQREDGEPAHLPNFLFLVKRRVVRHATRCELC